MNFSKKHLSKKIAYESGFSFKQVLKFTDYFFFLMKKSLKEDKSFNITCFGSLTVQKRKNSSTSRISFTPSLYLKKDLQQLDKENIEELYVLEYFKKSI